MSVKKPAPHGVKEAIAEDKKRKKLPALNFDKIFDDYIKGNQKKWEHDRAKTLGASEAFDCMRKNFFKKHGYEDDEDYVNRWGAMQRGNLIEDYHVVPAMEQALPKEYDFLGGGADQETFIKGLLSATPDGLIVDLPKYALENYGIDDIESDCIVLEIKSIDPRVNMTEEKAIHRGQVQAQMGLIREMSDFEPVYAIIIYLDASFLDDVEYFVVKFDPKAYEVANKRAETVFGAKSPADVKAEGLITGACEYCPYTKRCRNLILESIPEEEASFDDVDDETREEFDNLANLAKEASKAKSAAEKDLKAANEDVKEFLRGEDVRRMVGNAWKVAWSKVAGRKSYDFDAMKEDGIDLAKYEKTGAGFDKLTISENRTK